MSKAYDVLCIGGSLMAASTAYALLSENPDLKVLLIEKDPTYKYAATPLAMGGVRQQFSERVNIRMARHSIGVFENFDEIMETKAFGRPQIDFRQGGYLFLVSAEKMPVAMENAEVQLDEGVELQHLTVSDLQNMLPETDLGDVVGGTICHREGILDPQSVLNGYLRKVREMGAEIVHDEVMGLTMDGRKIVGVECKSGAAYSAGAFVNAAGPWARIVGLMAGVEVPVDPLPHDIYVCKIPMEAKMGTAYTTLPSTTWWFREHQDGDTIMCGKTKWDFSFGFDYSADVPYFEAEVWPDLADRMAVLDRLKMINSWRGCYEYNNIDFNAIIGLHPDAENFYLINGFSGHGMMQAPAAGRGVSELILHGGYRTLDLSQLNVSRFRENKLVIEKAII